MPAQGNAKKTPVSRLKAKKEGACEKELTEFGFRKSGDATPPHDTPAAQKAGGSDLTPAKVLRNVGLRQKPRYQPEKLVQTSRDTTSGEGVTQVEGFFEKDGRGTSVKRVKIVSISSASDDFTDEEKHCIIKESVEDDTNPPSMHNIDGEESVDDASVIDSEPMASSVHCRWPDLVHGIHGTKEESTLRAFDLDLKFGPCVGLSRQQRWYRAQSLGLNPPMAVIQLFSRANGSKLTTSRCAKKSPNDRSILERHLPPPLFS